jgi:UDP-N-acetylmuramate--alanine ligase
MKLIKKQVLSKEVLLEVLKKNRPELLLTMGAGDIDNLVIPIETIFND